MSNVEEVIKNLIATKLGVDKDKVTATASFVDDLGADSLDTVELVLALEEEFGVEIPDDDAAKIHTYADVLAYIQKHPKVAAKV
jgi:acyl carrier protein